MPINGTSTLAVTKVTMSKSKGKKFIEELSAAYKNEEKTGGALEYGKKSKHEKLSKR